MQNFQFPFRKQEQQVYKQGIVRENTQYVPLSKDMEMEMGVEVEKRNTTTAQSPYLSWSLVGFLRRHPRLWKILLGYHLFMVVSTMLMLCCLHLLESYHSAESNGKNLPNPLHPSPLLNHLHTDELSTTTTLTKRWGGYSKNPQTNKCYRQERTAMLLALLLGTLGVDQWYAHHWALAIFKMLTVGGLGTWAFVDVILWVVGGVYGTPGCPGGNGWRY